MDIHKNARSLPSSRALLVERVEKQGWSLSGAAKAAGLTLSAKLLRAAKEVIGSEK